MLLFSKEREALLLRINVRDLLPVYFQLHVASDLQPTLAYFFLDRLRVGNELVDALTDCDYPWQRREVSAALTNEKKKHRLVQ